MPAEQRCERRGIGRQLRAAQMQSQRRQVADRRQPRRLRREGWRRRRLRRRRSRRPGWWRGDRVRRQRRRDGQHRKLPEIDVWCQQLGQWLQRLARDDERPLRLAQVPHPYQRDQPRLQILCWSEGVEDLADERLNLLRRHRFHDRRHGAMPRTRGDARGRQRIQTPRQRLFEEPCPSLRRRQGLPLQAESLGNRQILLGPRLRMLRARKPGGRQPPLNTEEVRRAQEDHPMALREEPRKLFG